MTDKEQYIIKSNEIINLLIEKIYYIYRKLKHYDELCDEIEKFDDEIFKTIQQVSTDTDTHLKIIRCRFCPFKSYYIET